MRPRHGGQHAAGRGRRASRAPRCGTSSASLEALSERDDLPHVRALLESTSRGEHPSFRTQFATVLAGIAARRGDDWHEIAAMVDDGG